jgi:hypothetical protein
VTSPTTEVLAQTLHDFIEDEMAAPEGSSVDDIINPEGKIEDPANPGIFSQIIIILNSPWQVQFWGGSGYTRLYGGKIVGGLSDEVMKATGTAGDITVLESPVDGIYATSSGSNLSPQDLIDIADAVWEKAISNPTVGSFGELLVAVARMTGNKLTLLGDIATIYEEDEVTPWRQYNLANDERIPV